MREKQINKHFFTPLEICTEVDKHRNQRQLSNTREFRVEMDGCSE